SIFPPQFEHDIIVGRLSQEGGMPTDSTTTSVFGLFNPGPDDVATHLSVTNSDPGVADRVIELLNMPVTNTVTYATGFASNTSGAGSPAGISLPDYGDVIAGLVITDPPPGTTVAPGDDLVVTVQATDGFVPVHVLMFSGLGTGLSDQPPFDLTLDVPLDAIGAAQVNVYAFDANWNMAVADPVAIRIEVPASLTGIDIDPQETFLFSFGPDSQLRVTGHYDDGIDRQITTAQLDTTYQSLNPGIATVDADGVVTAVSVGTAVVMATNGQHSATAEVVVVNLTCLGDIDQDGSVTVMDFLELLSLWGQPGGPADIVDPPGVGIEDFLMLLANWGPCPSG
ncbi:MAG: Ig-like domain-containing protein, partial [Phycisphaerales bacterium]